MLRSSRLTRCSRCLCASEGCTWTESNSCGVEELQQVRESGKRWGQNPHQLSRKLLLQLADCPAMRRSLATWPYGHAVAEDPRFADRAVARARAEQVGKRTAPEPILINRANRSGYRGIWPWYVRPYPHPLPTALSPPYAPPCLLICSKLVIDSLVVKSMELRYLPTVSDSGLCGRCEAGTPGLRSSRDDHGRKHQKQRYPELPIMCARLHKD